ncbi:MAG: hypothetical protein D6772_04185 [Bacteroidetes bacterium]|nr:MAG: hypothetical protein D6772_04185 [Bacteroidota bacterium]
MRLPFLLLLVCTWLSLPSLEAQRVILVEKRNSARTQKLFAGDYIQYRIIDDPQWYKGYIEELRPDQQLIGFKDRYVPIADIRQLRRGRAGPRNIGLMLGTFGLAWSGFAAVGTATDGDPDTNYRWSDAVVSGISCGVGFLLPALFGTKKTKVGTDQRYRLRIVDLSF